MGGAIEPLFGRGGKSTGAGDMDAILTRIHAGRRQRFFCSQFVVFVYQFVAEQNRNPGAALFNVSDAKAEPSELAAKLLHRQYFQEIGYMMHDQR